MKKIVAISLIIIIVIALGLLFTMVISWSVANNKPTFSEDDLWLLSRYKSIDLEQNNFKHSVIESRRSYMYGLCEVAVRLDCLYQSEDRTIQYYLIRYKNKYTFKTEEVKNGLKKRVSGELMNYIVVVNTNSSDDLDLIIQEVGVNNT